TRGRGRLPLPFAEGAAISPHCLASVLPGPRLIRANAGSVAQIFENPRFSASTQHSCKKDGVSVAGMSQEVSTVHLSTGRPLRHAGFLIHIVRVISQWGSTWVVSRVVASLARNTSPS